MATQSKTNGSAATPAAEKKAPAKKAEAPKAEAPKAPAKDKAGDRTPPSHSGRTDGVSLPSYTLPAGYHMRWAHGSFDLLKLVNPSEVTTPVAEGIEGTPKWLVTCNVHGTYHAADSAKEGDKIGSNDPAKGRPSWCPGCRTAAAAPAKKAEPEKAAAKAPAAKAAAPKPGPAKKATTPAT